MFRVTMVSMIVFDVIMVCVIMVCVIMVIGWIRVIVVMVLSGRGPNTRRIAILVEGGPKKQSDCDRCSNRE
jgi:hypothetical protein